MNYALFLSILNIILLGRLRLILKDEELTRKDLLIIGGIPFAVLPFFELNLGWFLLLIYFVGAIFLMNALESMNKKRGRNRGWMMILHIVVITLFCSPLSNLAANDLGKILLKTIDRVMVPESNITGATVLNMQIISFGLLLVLNEMNILLRYLFQLMGLETLGNMGTEVDEKEFNTGRLIGLLERIFVFVFVLLGQYTAIGFILAAKGVARFQDFKSRTFAEYVLIGTLLSTLLAMAIGYAVKLVL